MTISHTIAQVSTEVLTFLDKKPGEDLSAFCYLEKTSEHSSNKSLDSEAQEPERFNSSESTKNRKV